MAVTAKKGSNSTSTYNVAGAALSDINKEMDKKGPKDPNDGSRYSGSCIATLSLNIGAKDFAFETVKGSSPTKVTATFSAGNVSSSCEIVLPKLASNKGLSSAALKEWNRFVTAVETHEDGHVDAYFAEAKAIAGELNDMSASGSGANEKAAQVAAQKALLELAKKAYGGNALRDRANASAKAYDAKTRHGESQKAVLDAGIS